MPTLDWLNRADAFTTAPQVPYRLLDTVSQHGTGTADNLLIQGDNRGAGRALQGSCRGQVRGSFIDRPYSAKRALEH